MKVSHATVLSAAFVGVFYSTGGAAGGYGLDNGFLSIEGDGGTVHSLRIDPEGGGDYGANLIEELMIGVPNLGGLPERTYEVETTPNELRLRDLTVYLPEVLDYNSSGYPHDFDV